MKRPWALALARMYSRRRLARAMDGVWVHGLPLARAHAERGPVVFCATHAAWWDALVLVALDEALGTDSYALMDARQLAQYPFFAAFGAIGLDRRSPASMRRGLATALARLGGPAAVWVFPQGRHRGTHLRPLGLHRGFELLSRAPGVCLIPVALTYAFRDAPQPSVLVSFGAPTSPAELESALIAGLDRIDRFVEGETGGFDPLIAARGARIDRSLATRLLGAFTGGARG